MKNVPEFSRLVGLHPLVGFGMFAIDLMLFGSGPVGWIASVPVGIALTVPCVLIQKYGMNEPWGLAIGKGLLVGVLTAIPTPLPSVVPFIGGMIGLKMLRRSKLESIDDQTGVQ